MNNNNHFSKAFLITRVSNTILRATILSKPGAIRYSFTNIFENQNVCLIDVTSASQPFRWVTVNHDTASTTNYNTSTLLRRRDGTSAAAAAANKDTN